MDDEVTMSLTLPLDDDGFLRRECPSCERQFKWLPDSSDEDARADAVEGDRPCDGVDGRQQPGQPERGEIRVVDDYAHHPTELSATLEVARATRRQQGRVIAVFQPHRYSRTRALYREFGEALTLADAVLVTEVYGAGEMPQPGVSGKLVVDALCESPSRPDVYYIPDQHDIPGVLRTITEPRDTVLTMGAGDISRVGDELLGLLG